MKTFLVEQIQKNPRWGRPIKHAKANNAKDATQKFDYLLDCTPKPILQAHELKYNDLAEICGKEDCPECHEYLHNKMAYYCHTPNCNTTPSYFSQYEINEGNGVINCEYCDKPLRKIKP